MKDMLEEYGWAITATIVVLGLLGLLFSLSSPSNPLGDAVRKLLMAATYFTGLILSTLTEKDKQAFEFRLQMIESAASQKKGECRM